MALSDVLGNIPGYGGFVAQQQLNRENRSGDLTNQVNQMKLADLAQGMQRKQALQKIYSATGGDPEKAIPLLMQGGFGAEAKQMADMLKEQSEQAQKQKLGEIGSNISTLNRPDLQEIPGGVGYAGIREPELKANIAQATTLDPAVGKQLQEQVFPEQGKKDFSSKAKELIDAGYKYGTPEFNQAMRAYMQESLKKSGVTQVTNVGQGETEFQKTLGKEQAAALVKSKAAADEATQIIGTVNEGKKILNEGMVTGYGANFIVGFGQALKQIGIDVGGDATANAQAYSANMAQNVGRVIKQFGAGTGLSDADREYAARMSAGDITLDEKALRRILDINEKAARNIIKMHNKNAKGVEAPLPLEVNMPTLIGVDLNNPLLK